MRLLTFQKAQMDINQTNGRDKWRYSLTLITVMIQQQLFTVD